MASKLNLKQQIFMNRASPLQGSQHFSFCQGKPRKKSFPFKREVNDGQQERECWKLNTRKSFWTEGRLDRIHQLCAWSLRLCCKPLINRGVLFIDTRGNHILHAALSILRAQRLRKYWRNKVCGAHSSFGVGKCANGAVFESLRTSVWHVRHVCFCL